MANSILKNKESMLKFLGDSGKDYERFKSDRDSIGFDEKMKVADGMWRCFQNRSLADSEREKATDSEETKSSVGSVRFFKMVGQKASLGNAVTSSVDVPFKYKTIANPEVWGSAEEAQSQTAIHNVLARYAWKHGKCDEKMYKFWFQQHKYCNVPVQVIWEKEKRRIAVKDPKTNKVSWKDKVVKSFPTFKTLHWSMVYADLYAPNIADQNCVVVLSVVPWVDIQKGVKNGWYDKDAVAEIRKDMTKFRWNGTEGAEAREEQVENAGESGYSVGESDLFLMWDIYRWAPIKSGNYDDEADYELYWCTTIGNTIGTSTAVRMERDFDPDGEIPLAIIKTIPDDSDLLYGMAWAEAIRAQYSVECTLWEESIDNVIGINNPFMLWDSSQWKEAPDDFTYTKGGKHDVDDVERAIKEFPIRDVSQATTALLQLVQGEESMAANMNSNMMGEINGGRTSASEGLALNRFSQQPNLGETSFILNQLVTMLARKYKSFWQAYGDPTQIKMIADEALDAPAYDDEAGYKLYGEFDIETNVVDEFQEDNVQAAQELQLLQTFAANPQLLQSKTHSIDLGVWSASIMRRLNVADVDQIVKPAKGTDAQLRQREEIRYMMQSGEQVTPQEGEDHDAHISVLNAEILRYKPLMQAKLPEGADQSLIDQTEQANDIVSLLLEPHRQAHEQMKLNAQNQELQQAQQAQQQEQAGGGVPTEGQQSGNVIAGALGGVNGGSQTAQ